MKGEIDENEKKFLAYKERAQHALKKLTKDEQEMKKKAKETEESHIRVYVDKIETLETKLGACEEEIKVLIETSDSAASDLRIAKESIENLEVTKSENIAKIQELDGMVKDLNSQLASQSQLNEEEISKIRKEYDNRLENQRISSEESKKISREINRAIKIKTK